MSDKDLFAEFYRKKLSRRLLYDKSANDDHERCMLTSLKQQFGAQFTSKMEGMVMDLQLARENQVREKRVALSGVAESHQTSTSVPSRVLITAGFRV